MAAAASRSCHLRLEGRTGITIRFGATTRTIETSRLDCDCGAIFAYGWCGCHRRRAPAATPDVPRIYQVVLCARPPNSSTCNIYFAPYTRALPSHRPAVVTNSCEKFERSAAGRDLIIAANVRPFGVAAGAIGMGHGKLPVRKLYLLAARHQVGHFQQEQHQEQNSL